MSAPHTHGPACEECEGHCLAPVVVPLELPENLAYALAQLCKRISFSTCRELSSSEVETYEMIRVTDMVRSALETAGVVVR